MVILYFSNLINQIQKKRCQNDIINLLILFIYFTLFIMSTLKRFSLFDTFEYSYTNLDILTETFSDDFYGKYIIKWPEYCVTITNACC